MKRCFIVLLSLLVLGCSRGPSTTETFTPAQIIEKSRAAAGELNTFHFELTQTSGTPIAMGLNLMGASGDISRPGKMKMDLTATASGFSIRVSVINIGQDTFMTNPLTGKWETLPSAFDAVRLFDPDRGIESILGEITSPVRLDDGQIEGVDSYYLRGALRTDDLSAITSGMEIKGQTVSVDIWVGKTDFQMRQATLNGAIAQGEESGMSRTIKLSRFDAPVTIEPPATGP